MAVLVLGGYGLIGSAVVARLCDRPVAGLGRDVAVSRRRWPGVDWREADLAQLLRAEDWTPLLAGVESVVNAAGVLQQGLRDDVAGVQERAMLALYAAARQTGIKRIVQISAVGAEPRASTEFLRSKARADDALRASGLDYVILRPGLVISSAAYGGTALIRAVRKIDPTSKIVAMSGLMNSEQTAELQHLPRRAPNIFSIRSKIMATISKEPGM